MSATGKPDSATAVAEPAQIELLLSQIESLPTLPEVATRLLEVTADDTSSARAVIELIESDQSLSARILTMANRAEVGTSADTVRRAVTLLGFDAVRSLVLSIQVFQTFPHRREPAPGRLDRAGFWKHSLAVGCAARLLAEEASPKARSQPGAWPHPEEAFTCGLLHDIGKVVLDACFPKSYDRVIARVEALRGCVADAEREVFGVDHTIAGQRLAVHWKLPAMVRESIWLHHHHPASTPTRIEHAAHVRLVQVADRLVRQMRIGYSGNYAADGPLAALAASAGVSDEQLRRVTAALPELIETRAELIGLDGLTSSEVYQGALAEANTELARVNESLMRTNRQLEQRSRCFEALRAFNTRLSNDPTHEDVCRAAAQAAQSVLDAPAVAVCGLSAKRSIVVAAIATDPDGPARVKVLPASVAGGALASIEPAIGWRRTTNWPGAMLDGLAAELGGPPRWYWLIRHQGRAAGAIVVAEDPPAGADDPLTALADVIGAWLSGAESRVTAQQLNEELAEINRRLVGSQTQLARVRSLKMVGEMAAGAAHELNNPLAVISGRAQMLDHDEMPGPVRETARLIAEHAHRASAIVQELMEFAKPPAPEPGDYTLPELLGDIRRRWIEENALREDQFVLDLSDDLPPVHVDKSQITTLFDEVIRNAIEALRETRNPMLTINCLANLTDDRVVIRVEDNGGGMSGEVLEHAMDPFFSHRPAGRGRGLGLSRAARYAEINGGRIRLTSELDRGTVVFVELPTGRGN